MTPALSDLSWPKTTARLTIRPPTADDVEPTWQYRRLPQVGEWITAAPGTVEEYAVHFLDQTRLAKTLIIELDGQVVGDLMLALEDAWSQSEVADRARAVQAELGWVLHPEHAGIGLATEAVAELLRLCFEELGLRRVVASCFADNHASWRLMERLGMRREAHNVRESLHRSGRWLDGLGYALLAEEWRELRETGRQTGSESTGRFRRHDWWGVVLDSPDPRALADFYVALLGWKPDKATDTWCTLAPGDGVAYLACQRSPDFERPAWPNEPGRQQMMLHLDFEVTDLTTAVERAVDLGASLLEHQPQEGVRVLADPDGHPFCLYTS
jgi:RimJ/RimL family protein N-acetyltransferase/catechol 2,3-dioxygenase-like lactoylglutathione lyase family enzyme